MSDGKLQYEITANSAGLVGAVNQAMTSIGGLSAKIAGVAGIGVLGGGAAGLGFGVALAAEREQVEVALKNIIGDAQKAKGLMKNLSQFAKENPLGMDEILAASRSLLGAGVPVEGLIDELKALGNVASAVGTDVGGLAMIYAQIAGKGKVYAEEMMQFSERGASMIKSTLQKTLGVTSSRLMEMLSEGKVGFADFQKALQSLAGQSGQLANALQEQAKTTKGLYDTLKETIDEVFLVMGAPINDAIKPVLTDAIGLTEELKPMMQEIGNVVAGMITAIRDFVAEAMKLDGTMTGVGLALAKALGDAFDSAIQYASGFGGVFISIAAAFGKAMLVALDPVMVAAKHGLASAALHAASVLLQSLSSLPGVGGMLKSQGMALGGLSYQQQTKASDALDGDKVFETARQALEGFGNDIAKAAADARDIFRGGNAGDNMQVGVMPEGPGGEPRQLLPNTTRDEAVKEAEKKPVKSASTGGPAPAMGSPARSGRADLRAADMAAAGGGGAMDEDGGGRSRISGANNEKRLNWRAREWQRMGAGARNYFGSSMYGGRAEQRTNEITGRGTGRQGGRERRDTTNAAATKEATSSNLLNAMLGELRKMNQHISSLKAG